MNKMEKLYQLLMGAGKELKIINFGSHAMNSMRMEKGYRGWGTELTPEISVVEAGLDRFFNLDKKNEFVGSKAIRKKLNNGIKIKLVYLELEADSADALGNEPIYYKNERVGLTTSGAYGFRVNKSLAFGYVNSDLIKNDTKFLIDIQGKKVKAKIIEEPAFDPKNLRLKS
jgi:dimethylglycine dehydrogenase